jgi:tetratricopeptide (TPR) repeat protein
LRPLDPDIGYALAGLGFVLLKAERLEEALVAAQRSLQEAPSFLTSYRLLITCLVWLGRPDEAKRVARRLLDLAPDLTVAKCRAMTPGTYITFRDRYMDALRNAGIPE